MDKVIHYDFDLSKSSCENLNNIVRRLSQDITVPSNDMLMLLSGAWRSPRADLFADKFRSFVAEVGELNDRICEDAERIQRVSAKMYIIEQEAKRLALEKET